MRAADHVAGHQAIAVARPKTPRVPQIVRLWPAWLLKRPALCANVDATRVSRQSTPERPFSPVIVARFPRSEGLSDDPNGRAGVSIASLNRDYVAPKTRAKDPRLPGRSSHRHV